MARDERSGSRLDWADAAVPVLASVCFVIKQGNADPVAIVSGGIGYALAVAVLFVGVRQIIWAVNRRRPSPRPRQPALAAGVGILIWAFILFRH
jgi:hypothetical protein